MAPEPTAHPLGSLLGPQRMLEGVRVLELGTFVAVPFAGRLLRMLGAAVTRVDQPDDPVLGLVSAGAVTTARFLREGKDTLAGPVDGPALDEQVRRADVTIADKRTLPDGWSPPDGALVVALEAVPGAGDPLADGHLACAMAAVSVAMGEPQRAPLPMPEHTADLVMGVVHAGAALARLIGGETGLHTISGVTALSSFVEQNSTSYRLSGIGWRREGRRAAGSGGIYPYGLFSCRDGQVALIARSRRDWKEIAAALGAEEVWERHQDPFLVARSCADEVDRELEPILSRLSRADVLRQAEEHGVLAVPVADTRDVLGYEHLAERGFWQEIDGQRVPGLPFMLIGEDRS